MRGRSGRLRIHAILDGNTSPAVTGDETLIGVFWKRTETMGRVDAPALKGTWLGKVLGAWNPVMKRILTSPLHWPLSRWFAVIEWTGRKSGKRYATPVAYLAHGNETWVTTGDRGWRYLDERPNVRI